MVSLNPGRRRILLVSSTVVGGSGRSQRALARALRARGHEVAFLVDDERPARWKRRLGERLADAAARFDRVKGLDWLARQVGRRLEATEVDGLEMWTTLFPENGLHAALSRFGPDVVVGNSMVRYSWRRIRETCSAAQVPTVLYVRGVASLDALGIEPNPADVIVANAQSLAEEVAAAGHECFYVPSLVDTSATAVESTREVALLVNPIPSHGIDRLWAIAEALPDIPFVIQESWPLDDDQVAAIEREIEAHPNVRFRRRVAPGPGLYADARVLLVPHRIDNRPRVIMEGQHNAIPALVSDFGGLREALGAGGEVVPEDANAWIDAVRASFEDDTLYRRWSDAALGERHRRENDPEWILDGFETVIETAIDQSRRLLASSEPISLDFGNTAADSYP